MLNRWQSKLLWPMMIQFNDAYHMYASPRPKELMHWPLWDLNEILILNLILVTDGREISWNFLRWMYHIYVTDDKSTLVKIMAWCRQATSHYLNQCWPRYAVTRPQWVNTTCEQKRHLHCFDQPFVDVSTCWTYGIGWLVKFDVFSPI